MEIRNGFNSLIVILNIIFFIGTMQVVVIQSKSHKNDLDPQFFFQDGADRNTPPPLTGIGLFQKLFSVLLLLLYILCCRSVSYKVHHHDVQMLNRNRRRRYFLKIIQQISVSYEMIDWAPAVQKFLQWLLMAKQFLRLLPVASPDPIQFNGWPDTCSFIGGKSFFSPEFFYTQVIFVFFFIIRRFIQ